MGLFDPKCAVCKKGSLKFKESRYTHTGDYRTVTKTNGEYDPRENQITTRSYSYDIATEYYETIYKCDNPRCGREIVYGRSAKEIKL